MLLGTQTAPVSKTMLWVGRVISALMIVFMLFDAGVKILKLPVAMEGTTRLGYPASVIQPIGIVALACVLLYAIPRTSILGAILLTGLFGRRDRHPGTRPGRVVHLSRCSWRIDLGRTLLAG